MAGAAFCMKYIGIYIGFLVTFLLLHGMAVGLVILGFPTSLLRLDTPKHIVFDEMHYGKYVSLYLNNTFFLDANPANIALAGYLTGFYGKFSFDKIGQEYSNTVLLWHPRFLPAPVGPLL